MTLHTNKSSDIGISSLPLSGHHSSVTEQHAMHSFQVCADFFLHTSATNFVCTYEVIERHVTKHVCILERQPTSHVLRRWMRSLEDNQQTHSYLRSTSKAVSAHQPSSNWRFWIRSVPIDLKKLPQFYCGLRHKYSYTITTFWPALTSTWSVKACWEVPFKVAGWSYNNYQTYLSGIWPSGIFSHFSVLHFDSNCSTRSVL